MLALPVCYHMEVLFLFCVPFPLFLAATKLRRLHKSRAFVVASCTTQLLCPQMDRDSPNPLSIFMTPFASAETNSV